ncbi:hypothetical protein Pfo_013062 [Paulownia fortunei]|nr:hypothetical protein Pfo_013062 [Paulownia fortunei]
MSEPNAIAPEWLLLLLNILLCFALSTSQPNCLNRETYANNSTYQANLNTLISSLSPNIGSSGFYNASIGQSPDEINAIVLCRGDISLRACRECVDATAPALVQRCLNNKDAIFWNETCMVRYSSQPIFGRLQTVPVSPNPSSSRVMNPREHSRELRALLESLKEHAANGGSFQKIAAGNRSTSDLQVIYALEQCTPDLTVQECSECLTQAIQDIPTCCGGIIGAGILRPSCTLRFENYHFYSTSVVEVPQEPWHPGKDDDTTTRTALIIVVSIAACLMLSVTVGILLRKRIKQKFRKKLESELAADEISTVDSIQYDFGKIEAATNGFSDANKLGEDGFGAVYRGKLLNGREIVVKGLSGDSRQGNLDFKNEVLTVARLQHRNLVRLLGFSIKESIKESERLLVYEFVRNGSLDKFMLDPIKRSYLDWNKRCKIIEGIAQGLLYLHENSRLRSIHGDLKAKNILLDGEMKPKISDFGTSRIVGTYGYTSPEYAMHGQFFDVFSFGVLVLEIVSCVKNRKNAEDLLSSVSEDLKQIIQNVVIYMKLKAAKFSQTWNNWCQGTAANLIDPVLKANTSSLRDMLRCIHIGLLCVQENVANRPTMASVVLMLNYFSITLPLPSKPACFTASHYGSDISVFQEYNSKELKSNKTSKSKTDTAEDSYQIDV